MSRPRALLLTLLAAQLLCADALRWPLTTAPIKSNVEYLLGQEVIASEHWRREGAIASHFIPSRSIDQNLPEWWFRDVYWRDYLSQPPLSWMLEYGASRLFDAADPVIVGKLLAQAMTAVALLVSGPSLMAVFGFGAALAALSFVIWSPAFLTFFVDGYYSTTPAVLCQIVLASWGVAFFGRELATPEARPGPLPPWRDLAVAALLAFLGTFSEWVALFGNAVAVAVFCALGLVFLAARDRTRACKSCAFGLAIGVGSVVAEVVTVTLYASRIGWAFYWGGFLDRVNTRTGDTPFWPYTKVLFDRMQSAWPRDMLIVLAAMLIVVVVWAMCRLWIDRRAAGDSDGALLLLAVALGFGSGATYCYRLTNLVTIHWWFTGTWIVGWMMTICAFAFVVRRMAARVASARWASVGYTVVCAVLWGGAAGWNLHFVHLTPPQGLDARDFYRELGRDLPPDAAPLVVADLPDLFFDYPFPTTYLRRAIVRFSPPRLLFKLGTTEDAGPALRERGGVSYLLYDASLRQCVSGDVTPISWRGAVPLAVCRVSSGALARNPADAFRHDDGGPETAFPAWVAGVVDNGSCCDDPRRLLATTKRLDSGLRVKAGSLIDAVRRDDRNALRTVVERWRTTGGGTPETDDRSGAPAVSGVIADADAWYLLFANLAGATIADASALSLRVNGNAAAVVTPPQILSDDHAAVLPFSLIVTRPIADVPDRGVRIELAAATGPITVTSNAAIVRVAPDGAGRSLLGEAFFNLTSRCGAPPAPPGDFHIVSSTGDSVALAWSASTGRPTSYVLEAGHAPGLKDLSNNDLGGIATAFTATGVKPGTYYARLRAKNACGEGDPSNEIVAVVR